MKQKLERLQHELQVAGVDCLALIPGANMKYMTGIDFHLMERPVLCLFFPEREPMFTLPDFEQSRLAGLDVDSITYTDGKQLPGEVLQSALARLDDLPTSVAVEFLNMRVFEYQLLLSGLDKTDVHNADLIMSKLRERKTEAETSAMRQAVAISETALMEVLSTVEPGITEQQLANQLKSAMTRHGGEHLPFEPLVLSGERSAMPHGETSNRTLETGDLILIDYGTSKNGYISDITRVFYLGEPSNEQIKGIHQTVQAANEAGRAAIKPGIPCEEVDRVTRAVIEQAGYGEYFIHRTGHGIGMEAHEEPYIVEGNTKLLQPGMTFTIEPGIYIPGIGGIRIEDNMLVTETGSETLTSLARGIHVI